MRPICAPFEIFVPAGVVEPPDEVDPELTLDLPQPETSKMATQVTLPRLALSRPHERSFMGVNRPLSFTPEKGGLFRSGKSIRGWPNFSLSSTLESTHFL
jgi:hypothetical protein